MLCCISIHSMGPAISQKESSNVWQACLELQWEIKRSMEWFTTSNPTKTPLLPRITEGTDWGCLRNTRDKRAGRKWANLLRWVGTPTIRLGYWWQTVSPRNTVMRVIDGDGSLTIACELQNIPDGRSRPQIHQPHRIPSKVQHVSPTTRRAYMGSVRSPRTRTTTGYRSHQHRLTANYIQRGAVQWEVLRGLP